MDTPHDTATGGDAADAEAAGMPVRHVIVVRSGDTVLASPVDEHVQPASSLETVEPVEQVEPTEPVEPVEPPAQGRRPWRPFRRRGGPRPMTRGRRIRRRILAGVAAAVVLFGVYFAWSFSGYVRDSQGEPTNVLLAEWGRDHHLGWFVAQAENFYYDHFDTVATGGEPTISTVVDGGVTPSATPKPSAGQSVPPPVPHLRPPPTVVSPVANPLKDEGVWQPVGSLVGGVPAIYVTRVRADAIHTSVLASMMWIDTKLTKALLVPGYIEPGGPNPSNGALPQQYDSRILANFNGAFRLQDSQGGYYYQGKTVAPLVKGKASAVIDTDGSIRIGAWGRDVSMGPGVAVVRQNLALIVDGGKSQVDGSGGGFSWGATTNGETYAWRSAIGQRADGSIVYIGSPGLSAQEMAATLVKAGVQRAMVLDMNNWWVAGFYFSHAANGAPACSKLDPAIQEGCDRFLKRYKRDSFQFIAAF